MSRRDIYDRITNAEIGADQTVTPVRPAAEIDRLIEENRYLLFGKLPVGRYFVFAKDEEEIAQFLPFFDGDPEIHDLDQETGEISTTTDLRDAAHYANIARKHHEEQQAFKGVPATGGDPYHGDPS